MIYTLTLNLALDFTYETDYLLKDSINKADLRTISVGGKGINISRALNCLGIKSLALGFCGERFYDFIDKTLSRENIKTDFIKIKGSSRINIKIIENKEKNLIELNEIGPFIQTNETKLLMDKIKTLTKTGDIFIIGGSLPRNIDVNIYRKIINILKKKRVTLLLDSSGRSLSEGLLALPEILKINLKELKETNKISDTKKNNKEIVKILNKYIAEGIKTIMITDGSKEVIYCDKNNYLVVRPPYIKGRLSSTGSGDSVDAGLVYSILNRYSAEDTLKFSVSCGSANLLNDTPGQIQLNEIKMLIKKVIVFNL